MRVVYNFFRKSYHFSHNNTYYIEDNTCVSPRSLIPCEYGAGIPKIKSADLFISLSRLLSSVKYYHRE